MILLETDRLIIRNFRPDDWQALHRMIGQYQASEYAAFDHPWPTSEEEIGNITAWFASGDDFLAVCLKEAGQFVGFVSLNPEQDGDSQVWNLGYVFDFDYHGQGFATEACRAVIERAFGPLQAQTVISGTAAANRPSCRLLERLGFRRIAQETCSFRSTSAGKPIVFLGYTYAISKEEWDAATRKSP